MIEIRKTLLETFPPDTLNTTAGDAMMLRIMIEATRAKRGIEVGTNAGYGAIHMGIGFERTGGHLYSVETDTRKAASARQNLEKAGLARTVTVIEGDALTVMPALEGKFDFVFIDALKKDYLNYLRILEPKLERGAMVVADNVIVCGEDMPDFLEYIQSSPDYDTVIIRASMEKNDGMSVSFKIR